MAKYEPLTAFLKRQERPSIRMSFQRLEEIIAVPLPPSARSTERGGETLSTEPASKHMRG
jgi:hypothetical protein